MTDMSPFIAAKSDQLNADDLVGGPRTIRITSISGNENDAQPVNINFDGDLGKPYRPCKSMRRVLAFVWGTDGNQYVGQSLTLYRDPSVTWGGAKVGGIRISHMSGIDKARDLMLTAARGSKRQYTVKPLVSNAQSGKGISAEQAERLARNAAARGKEAFVAWYNSEEGKEVRDAQSAILGPLMPDLERITMEADQKQNEADPFGLPPVAAEDEIQPTDAEKKAALEAAAAQAKTEEIEASDAPAPVGLG